MTKRISGTNSEQDPPIRDYVRLPYFDELLRLMHNGTPSVEQSFGRHVHWGYWQNPAQAETTGADFAQAAENLSEEVCRAADMQNGLHVLDAGCGFGGTVAHLNEQYTGMHLTGLNLDFRQLQRAQHQVVPRADNHVAFVQSNACTLPFPDRSFDRVLAVECIFHFPSRAAFFQEAWRVLKPSGTLALSDFIPTPMLVPLAKIRLPNRLSRGFYGKCNLHATLTDYRRLAEQTGFDLRVESDITANTLPTYSYLRSLVRQTLYFNPFAMIETAALEVLSRLRLVKYYIHALQK